MKKKVPDPDVVGFNIHEYLCGKCNHKVANDSNLPKKGMYCKEIIVETSKMFKNRITCRAIAKEESDQGVQMSPMAVLGILIALCKSLNPKSNEILRNIRRSKVLHADETSYKINGVKYWFWVFLNPRTGERYYTLTVSRGKKVVERVLGRWSGILVCDGWDAYRGLRRQRCWAHILREPEHAMDKGVKGAKHVWKMLSRIHDDGKRYARSRKGRPWRESMVPKLVSRVRRVVENCRKIPELVKFAGKLERAIPDLFVYVVNTSVPSTNNAAERALREIVVHRKIRGGARSEKTAEWLPVFFTCILTWEAEGKTVDEILNYV